MNEPDVPDIIAGACQYSRAYAYTLMERALAERYPKASPQPEATEPVAQEWQARLSIDRHQVVLDSADFEHDVLLILTGDFATMDEKLEYGQELAEKLNAAPQPSQRQEAALQALVDDAQDLDMGYGLNACPNCGKSNPCSTEGITPTSCSSCQRSLSALTLTVGTSSRQLGCSGPSASALSNATPPADSRVAVPLTDEQVRNVCLHTPHTPAQATIDALRAELAQANDERDERQAWCADESTRNRHLTRERDYLHTENERKSDAIQKLCKERDEARAEVARLTRERDAAFAMSRCECSPDEGCANLDKLHAELTEERKSIKELARIGAQRLWEITELKARQVVDVEAVMRLADEYAEAAQRGAIARVIATKCAALRDHLTKDRT